MVIINNIIHQSFIVDCSSNIDLYCIIRLVHRFTFALKIKILSNAARKNFVDLVSEDEDILFQYMTFTIRILVVQRGESTD